MEASRFWPLAAELLLSYDGIKHARLEKQMALSVYDEIHNQDALFGDETPEVERVFDGADIYLLIAGFLMALYSLVVIYRIPVMAPTNEFFAPSALLVTGLVLFLSGVIFSVFEKYIKSLSRSDSEHDV